MTIHTLDRPDAMPELADWLERHLVSDTLVEVIAELNAVHDPNATSPPLAELIPLETVLKSGLKKVPEDQVRRLFRHPDRLWELQERILIDGEAYWNQVPRPQHLIASSQRGLERLHQSMKTRLPVRTKGKPTWKWRLASLAALFLIGLLTGWGLQPSSALAWEKEEAFVQPKSDQEFLFRLAKLAKEWFEVKPTTDEMLATRIIKFRRGCARLQLHADVLPAKHKKWLLVDCRKWSDELDQQLKNVEDRVAAKSGTSLEVIRDETDQIIQKLITKLETKAKA